MPPSVVLVTGAAGQLGRLLVDLLQADPDIERVIGVDVTAPSDAAGRAEFVRADIRNPVIAKVIESAEVDTVVHLGIVETSAQSGGRSAMKETNVIGTMQLLAACQKVSSVRSVVVRSSGVVYGSSSRNPALFGEDDEPRSLPRSGFAKDVVEIEGYVRGLGRRRPDMTVTLLRFANFLGPHVESVLTAYLSLPVVPTVFGFDPRLQFIAETDALAVLHRAVTEAHPGVYNVAAPGVVPLSRAIHRAGLLPLPVLSPAVSTIGGLLRRTGVVDFSPEQLQFLEHGRALDISRLVHRFGYAPSQSSIDVFDAFVRDRVRPVYRPEHVATAEQRALDMLPHSREAARA